MIALLTMVLGGIGLGGTAFAAPTSVAVCTQVLDNGDVNLTEGDGAVPWSYSVANQAVTLQSPQIQRNESQSATAPTCQPSVRLDNTTPASTGLSITQAAVEPTNWLRDAAGYPKWTITDGTRTLSGSGLQAMADASTTITYAQFTGAVTVTFTNASGRLIKGVCKKLEDNGDSKTGQKGNFNVTAGGSTSVFSGLAEGATACDNSFTASIALGATSVAVSESAALSTTPPSAYSSASGYPKVSASDSASTTTNTALSFNNVIYSGTLPLTGTKGDLTVVFTNRIAASRTVTTCKLMEDNADGIDQGGAGNTVNIGPSTTISLPVVEGSTTAACTDPISTPSTDAVTLVRELQYPGTLQGFAPGYPKWAIYNLGAANPTVPVIQGTGTAADIKWNDPRVLGATNLRVQFTDRAGLFGNGAQANTGAVVRVCQYVEDNANGVTEGGQFNVSGQIVDPAQNAHVTGGTPFLNEGTLSCPVTMARYNGDNTARFGAPYLSAGWPGNVAGYPQIRTFNVVSPTASSTPLSQAQLAFSETPGLQSSYSGTVSLPTTGDVSAVVFNKTGGTARTITFCVKVEDNGLTQATPDGGAWTLQLPANGTITATEATGTVCGNPVPMPDPNGIWEQPNYTQTVFAPSNWPGFDVATTSPANLPASPYVNYTTSTGGSGTLTATGGAGNVMNWSGSQTFFQGLTGNLTVTFLARASGRFQVCSDVIDNGDGHSDSNTFGLSLSQGATTTGLPSVTAAEGTLIRSPADVTANPAQCTNVAVQHDVGAGQLAVNQILPGNWDSARTTPGFPQWSLSSSGGSSPVTTTGSGLTTSPITQQPASVQGNTLIVFNNRLGDLRFVKFCKLLVDNGDAVPDTGIFTINATSDDQNVANTPLGSYPLSVTEGNELCSAPVQVPVFATKLGANEVLPGGFISDTGYPKWAVRRSDGSTVTSGGGPTAGAGGDIPLTGINTTDFSVLFQNKKANSAELNIVKTVTKDSPPTVAGGEAFFTIVVTNPGPLPATQVVMHDLTPPGLTQDAILLSGCPGCTITNNTLTPGEYTGTVPTLAVGASVTYKVSYKVPANYLTNGGANPISNTATVVSATRDNNLSDNTSTVTLDVGTSTDLQITKTAASGTTYVPGSPVVYTIIASNAGPGGVTGAVVTDVLPAGLSGATWTCVGANGGTCPAATGTGNINATINVPVGGTSTFKVTANTAANATGTLTNTATITAPSGVTDTATTNNAATLALTAAPAAALTISNSDGQTTYAPGSQLTYTITAGNNGPSNVTGATLVDTLPASLTGATWTCVATGGGTCPAASGSGNISALINLPVSATVKYVLKATVAQGTTGSLSNTAMLTPPSGTTGSPASATDTDTFGPTADLVVSNSDGKTSYSPGDQLSYTIVASNPTGPSNVTGASLVDTLPGTLTSPTWTCTSTAGATCPAASGSGSINVLVNLPVGGMVTFVLKASVAQGTTGNLVNTATLTPPSGTTDPTPATATDTDTFGPSANLLITNNDGVGKTTYSPGELLTYTIVASNPTGPSNVTGATVTDTLPASLLTGATWTCTATGSGTCPAASGSGSINGLVDLRVGSVVTFVLKATVAQGTTGNLINSAVITVPSGVSETAVADNTAADTDTPAPRADLSITNSDGQSVYSPGGLLSYTITASNAGPSNVVGATLTDTLPASLTGATWTCTGTGGGVCSAASGSGNISGLVTIPVAGTVTYVLKATVAQGTTGNLVTTATLAPPSGTTDATPASATDTDTFGASADLAITLADGSSHAYTPGVPLVYTIVAGNTNGPSNVVGATVTDTLPASLTGATWTCVGATGGTCPAASGNGNINATVNLPLGGKVTFVLTANIVANTSTAIANTASVTLPASIADPTPGNNSATDSASPAAGTVVHLLTAIDDSVTFVRGGTMTTYTMTVTNKGPSVATTTPVRFFVPTNLSAVTWTCSATASAVCAASGSGNIADTATIPVNGVLTYTLTGTVAKTPEKALIGSILTTAGTHQVDSDISTNSATDTDDVGIFANGFDSAALGAQSIDVQAAAGATRSVTVTPDRLSAGALTVQPQALLQLNDKDSGRSAVLEAMRVNGQTRIRLSFLAEFGDWQVGSWINLNAIDVVSLGWNAASSTGKRMLDHISLRTGGNEIDRIDMPQEQ